MTDLRGRIIVGTSGWRYRSWRGAFYPHGLLQRLELEHLASRLDSVEINGSFYSLQRASSYRRWRDSTPDGFVFAVKGGRYITHMLRMRNARTALANFYASGPLELGDKLGPFLWQLPEREQFDADALDAFCALLPADTHAAASLAIAHDEKVKDASTTELTQLMHAPPHTLRHALEVRHASFTSPESLAILRRHNLALVVADTAGRWPATIDVTADFVYVRLHGSQELYASGYTDEELRSWARRVIGWSQGTEASMTSAGALVGDSTNTGSTLGRDSSADGISRDVYVYFDNDAKTFAPFDATNLTRIIEEMRLDPN